MPVTALDPTTALIVVDLQAGIAGLPTVHPNPVAHENTISNIFPILGETGTTSDILAFLD